MKASPRMLPKTADKVSARARSAATMQTRAWPDPAMPPDQVAALAMTIRLCVQSS